jgi:uncharacterized circularly permuted ATP-grasp superfamily protein/uncharacterized alpha-E superfamily protein
MLDGPVGGVMGGGMDGVMGDVHAIVSRVAGLTDLARRQLDSDRQLESEGAGHIVHDLPVRADGRTVSLESRPWRLDPIPIVIDAAEFTMLGAALAARMRMLEALLDDVYGQRTLLTDRVLDPSVVWGSAQYRIAAIGQPAAPRWLTTYSADVIKDVSGAWHVVADYTDAPPGTGYSLLGRSVMARVHRDVIAELPRGGGLRAVEPFADQLRDALADLSQTESPRIVVMSGGVEHPSFVGQSYLASRLGLNLAEGADLVVRQRRLWMRSLAGLEPIDVLHRRLEADRVDPMEVNAHGVVGVPGLLSAVRAGGLRLANAHGTGVIEDQVLADQWDDAGGWIAERHRSGGATALRRLLPAERTSTNFAGWPCFIDNQITQRQVVVRVQLVASDRGIDVMQGASGRVLMRGDDPVAPTAATAKDVWVIGGSVSPPSMVRRRPLPQVDLIASVPTRAAEALFWAGRAFERAELIARALEIMLDRTAGVIDPATAEPWVTPVSAMLAGIAGIHGIDIGSSNPAPAAVGAVTPEVIVHSAADALANQIGSALAEVTSVREFFSTTAGRAFARLAVARSGLQAAHAAGPGASSSAIDRGQLDNVLLDLSAVIGLWNESVVRGPAWRFGEIGRRIERVFGVIDGVRGALVSRAIEPLDAIERNYDAQRLLESILATNESLVAYRRRHRSDIEFALAMHLVISDERNPRAAATALTIISEQAQALGWSEGVSIVAALLDVVRRENFTDLGRTMDTLNTLWSGCDRLARGVVSAYLTTPLDPQLMGRPA